MPCGHFGEGGGMCPFCPPLGPALSNYKSWTPPPWCFQEHRHESGSLTLSGTVEHINSGDDAGTGHRPKKICFFNEMENNTFNV